MSALLICPNEQEKSLTSDELFDQFQKLPLSQNMQTMDLKLILRNMSHHNYQQGDVIYSAGQTSKGELSLILSGTASASDASGHRYTSLSSGDVFGLFSFLDDERIHAATVKAESALQVVRLSRASFDRIATYQPILENLLLRFMFRLLSKTTLKIEHEYAAIHEYALGRKV